MYGIPDVLKDKDPLGSGCTESYGMGTPVWDGQRCRKETPMAVYERGGTCCKHPVHELHVGLNRRVQYWDTLTAFEC